MEPGDVYLKGDGYRAIIAHVFGDMIVIINQEIDSGLWVDREEPYRLSLFCDLDSECWAEKFEQQPGESWEQAVARAVATFHAESGSAISVLVHRSASTRPVAPFFRERLVRLSH